MQVAFTLDEKGLALAGLLGVLVFFLGANQGPFFLGVLVIFLALSAIVTRIGRHKKVGVGVYEKVRGWKNVLSNGLVPLAISAVYFINQAFVVYVPCVVGRLCGPLYLIPPGLMAIAYIASVAAVTADKFSSEIGVLDGEPMMLVTLKRTKKGTSGGITGLGTLAGLFGALLIAVCSLFVFQSLAIVLILTASGIIGSLVDSVLGYWEEEGIGNKYTSNFACAVAGAVACAALLALAHLYI